MTLNDVDFCLFLIKKFGLTGNRLQSSYRAVQLIWLIAYIYILLFQIEGLEIGEICDTHFICFR